MITLLIITGLLLFTIASGILSGSETALFSISPTKIALYKEDPNKRKKVIAELVSNPHSLLVTILLLNIFVNIVIQNLASDLFTGTQWALKVGIPLGLTLIFGEIIPKSIALQNNTKVAYFTSPIIAFAKKVSHPIRSIIAPIVKYVSRGIFFFLKKDTLLSRDELQHILSTSKEQGMLTKREAKLINGLINLQEPVIKEIMVPKDEISHYNIQEPIENLINLFIKHEYSRIPVCEENINNIKGIITARNFFLHQNKIHSSKELLKFIQKPLFIPETTHAKTLLKQFQAKAKNHAIAVDEYGSITGMITKEDIVEIITGDIADQHSENKHYTIVEDDVIIASGKLELTEFEHIFNFKLESKSNMATIGGWLLEQLETIPKTGTKYILNNFLFHILASEQNRIRRIYIRKIETKNLGEDE